MCLHQVSKAESNVSDLFNVELARLRDCRLCPIPVLILVQRAMKVDLPEPVIPITGLMMSVALLNMSVRIDLRLEITYLMISLGEFEVAMLPVYSVLLRSCRQSDLCECAQRRLCS